MRFGDYHAKERFGDIKWARWLRLNRKHHYCDNPKKIRKILQTASRQRYYSSRRPASPRVIDSIEIICQGFNAGEMGGIMIDFGKFISTNINFPFSMLDQMTSCWPLLYCLWVTVGVRPDAHCLGELPITPVFGTGKNV